MARVQFRAARRRHLPPNIEIAGVRVGKTNQINSGSGVLIEMDIIGIGGFAITRSGGNMKFIFRAPAQDGIDFVTVYDKQMQREQISEFAKAVEAGESGTSNKETKALMEGQCWAR